MKVCVLVPSDEYTKQAGVRIRYQRIIKNLGILGFDLQVVPIQNFSRPVQFTHDIYIISKCYDARVLLVACRLARSRKPVGVDLFDDYFSQTYDSRFTRLRVWLHALLQSVDFILCSTPGMRDLAANLAPGLAIHVMNDPSLQIDAEAMRLAMRRRLDYIHKTKILNIGWFGIGDNPHFPVGLIDLIAFSGELARLQTRGFNVRLGILTNRRAMTADGLAMLRRLPVPYTLEEWTEDRETALLVKSLVCFLPVNAQNFSTVKSLNRAVTTLSAGVQVLSAGYPLYEPLSPFIYRDPEGLLDDIEGHSPKLREETLPELLYLLKQWADPEEEARKLAEFLGMCLKRKANISIASKKQPVAAVIHGKKTIGDVHKFTQRMGTLSISSPFCVQKLNFDIRFSFLADGTGIEAFISEKYCSMLSQDVQQLLSPHGKILDRIYQKLDLSNLVPNIMPAGTALGLIDSPITFAASYARVMANVEKQVEFLFPGIVCLYSEHSKLPWWSPMSNKAGNREIV